MTDPTRRIPPNKGDWIAALCLQAVCPDCGEPLGDRSDCEYDHEPALADRITDKWKDVHPNDPRFVRIRHIDCHQRKTDRENSVRAKGDRNAGKHQAHEDRMNGKQCGQSARKKSPYRWPRRPMRPRVHRRSS